MYTRSHFAISAALGVAIAAATGATPARAAFLVAYAAILGTAIDLDHFLIARLRLGDWRRLRFAITHPRAAFLDQSQIFEDGDVGTLTRLLSHGLIAGALVAGFALSRRPFLAVFSGVVLYGHGLCDLVVDVRKYER